MDNQRLTMSLGEFSSLTGLSRNHVYSLVQRDQLGFRIYRYGKRILLSRAEVMNEFRGTTRKRQGNDHD